MLLKLIQNANVNKKKTKKQEKKILYLNSDLIVQTNLQFACFWKKKKKYSMISADSQYIIANTVNDSRNLHKLPSTLDALSKSEALNVSSVTIILLLKVLNITYPIIMAALFVVLLALYVSGLVTEKYRSKLMMSRFKTEALLAK